LHQVFGAHRQYAIGSLPRDRLTNVREQFSLERLVWIGLHLIFLSWLMKVSQPLT
jgi:hypothetical protein